MISPRRSLPVAQAYASATNIASTLATERIRYSTSHQLVQTQAGRPAHLSA